MLAAIVGFLFGQAATGSSPSRPPVYYDPPPVRDYEQMREDAAKENERLRRERLRTEMREAAENPAAYRAKRQRLQNYIDMQTAYIKRMREEQDG